MSTELTTEAEELVPRIIEAHEACNRCHGEAVAHAIKAGDLLLEAKSKVEHGFWRTWLKAACPDLKERAAQVYMQLAQLPLEIRSSAADLSMRGALAAIARRHAVTDQSKTVEHEGEAEEVSQRETDEEPNRIDNPVDDIIKEVLDSPGRSPEQKARDIADVAISDLKQRCHLRGVEAGLAMQTLIHLLTDELKMAMSDQAVDDDGSAMKARFAAMEESEPTAPAKKKRERKPAKLKGGPGKKRGPDQKKRIRRTRAEIQAEAAAA